LGCVYKLVEINTTPKIKLSEDVDKVTMPGKKDAYRCVVQYYIFMSFLAKMCILADYMELMVTR
jgi:nicotinic acid phosphoribosyltransferase